ncbi:hypothetical protein DBR43_31755 [Pedobacter sp. KBW06]|uniref:reverse transcriptase domain-containing protein n=1 Tax=Pedobacter sp. KBW06 TaxID=2153359 RepID=UPI000F5A416D|nr:reverse transcriptase domain-containing protein [Pedobacter sp. KBW06]RQO64857.1 hypothetical protein DBR43_31755 [Pedobacter sp. KBW06]
MHSEPIYSEAKWEAYAAKIAKNSKLKSYKHFDPIFEFKDRAELIKKLVSDPTLESIAQYSFSPLVKILTKTPRYKYDEYVNAYGLETKIRPISFAAHLDAYIYGFYAFVLTEAYQDYIKGEGFAPCVLAYRSDLNGDSNIQFAKRAFDSVKEMYKKYGKCSAIALDISGYFDAIDHKILKSKWCDVLGVTQLPKDQYQIYRSLTNYAYVGKANLLKHFNIKVPKTKKWRTLLDLIPDSINGASFQNKMDLLRKEQLIIKNKPKKAADGTISYRGIPQGSPMSSVLSNIYLLEFDRWLHNLSVLMDFKYFRYCDDLLVVCKSDNVRYLVDEIVRVIKDEFELTIQTRKSEIVEFRENSTGMIRSFDINQPGGRKTDKNTEQKFYKNLQYLGFEYNGTSIYIRSGSLSRYFRKAKASIVKTMMMAYGKNSTRPTVGRKKLYTKYSHFGRRNFISYAQNAAKKEYSNYKGDKREGLDSISIKRQLSAHFSFLEREISKTSKQFADTLGVAKKS